MRRVLLQTVTAEALAGLELADRDKPLSLLACRYAEAIDAAPALSRGDVLKELGPKLQAALESLGMSPAARARATGKGATDGATGAPTRTRDELRERRAAQAAG